MKQDAPAPKPTRARYMDFAPRRSRMSPEAVRAQNRPRVGDAARANLNQPTLSQPNRVAPQPTVVRQHFDTPTHHVHAETTESMSQTADGFVHARHTTAVAVPRDDITPVMTDEELSAALAGFADDSTVENSMPSEDVAIPDEEPSELDQIFSDEIEALDELTDDLSNDEDIDRIANELDAEEKAAKEEKISAREEKEQEEFAEEPKSLFEDKEDVAPDNNKYSLGGKSPFLTSVHIEKRPLSPFLPNMAVAQEPVKNVYERREEPKAEKTEKPAKKKSTIVISTPDSKASNIGLFIAIVLTIILGAGVGAIVYLAFFQ